MPQPKLKSVARIVDKLIDISSVMKNRMGLKTAEENRVNEAFALLAARIHPSGNKSVYLEFLQRLERVLGSKGVVLCAVGLGVSSVAALKDRVRVDLPHKLKDRWDEIVQGDLQDIANVYLERCEGFKRLLVCACVNISDPRTSCTALVATTQSEAQTHASSADNPVVSLDEAGPSQSSERNTATTNKYNGDAFIVTNDHARYALSHDEHVGEIWLTNPERAYNAHDGKKRSFLTLWVSEEMGEELGRRSKLMVASRTSDDTV